METLFKRHFWAVQLTVLVVSTLLLGAGTARFLLARFADYGVAIPPEGMAIGGGAGQDSLRVPDSISEVGFPQPPEVPSDPCADITCPEGQACNPTTAKCEVAPAEAPVGEDGPCVDSDIAMNLAGTMVSEDPEWSLAVFQNPTTKKTEFARIGSPLLAQAEVTEIYRSRVMIRRNGRIECIRPASVRQAAAARNQSRPAPSAPAAPSTVRPGTPSTVNPNVSPDELARTAVRRTGNNEYSVDRNAIDSVLANPTALREQAPSVSPYYRDGKAAGFRLNGVRAGSVFSSLGIRNGDVIQSVNGQAMDSPQRAMELYNGLRSAGKIELVIERGGRQQTVTYNVQ